MNHASILSRSGGRGGGSSNGGSRGGGRGGRGGAVRNRVLGDARRETVEAAASKARLARRRAEKNLDADDDDDDDDDDGGANAKNVTHDPDAPIFANAPYEDDDREADDIYGGVEERMRSRRLRITEARIQGDLESYRRANPTVPQQFADLKRKLSEVSEADWEGVPDVGDRSIQKRKLEKFTPAPDALLSGALEAPQATSVVESGLSSSTDLARISQGRTSVIGHKLDTASDSASGQTNIDPSGYLTEMAGMHITSDTEVNDIRKARILLKSVTTTNPKHAPGWIAAARLEEVAGKLSAARALITQGCYHCPNQEDVWLEAARLHTREQAKKVLANAVKHVPKSVKIWLNATALEDDPRLKKRVLRTALQVVPGSAKLWRTFVDLEDPQGARILLSRAVECVPNEPDLWIGLARLETYDNAKKVLNRALQHLRAEPSIWITGAKLEEAAAAAGSRSAPSEQAAVGIGLECPKAVARLINRAVQVLSVDEELVKRDRWLKEARDAEHAGSLATCRSIVNACLGVGIDAVDEKRMWQEDAVAAVSQGRPQTARAIHAKIVAGSPGDPDVWMAYAKFELQHGTSAQRNEVLTTSVKYCPRAEILWLMVAKEIWKNVGVAEAREVLTRAFTANPGSEAILLAAAKVETEIGEVDRARELLAKARTATPTARVFMKSALLERRCKLDASELKLLEDGLVLFSDAPRLWLMLAQYHERNEMQYTENGTAVPSKDSVARATYLKALRECPKSVALWCGLARLEERYGKVTKARATLEKGRNECRSVDNVDELWAESVLVEVRAGGPSAGQSILARSLKECETSGLLWSLAIAIEPRSRQRRRIVDALNCCESSHIFLEAGKLKWRERKIEKAREWLTRAVKADGSHGDALATLYCLECKQGTDVSRGMVEKMAEASSPKYGSMWTLVSKRPGNESLDTVAILRKTADLISDNTLAQITSPLSFSASRAPDGAGGTDGQPS